MNPFTIVIFDRQKSLLWSRCESRVSDACFARVAHGAGMPGRWSRPYDTWVVPDGKFDDAKRAQYIQELTQVIKGTVFKAFSHSVSLDHYDAVNADYRLDQLCKPFGLCAAQIMRDVAIWRKRAHPNDDVLYVFEDGDCDKGDLERTLQRRRLRPPHPRQFMPKRWKDGGGKTWYHRPFEACDLWAYEDGLAFRLVDSGKQTRRSHQYLNRHIPSAKFAYTEVGLRLICKELGVPRRR